MKTPTGRTSVIADVRRRQIIDAAVDVIAAEGLSRASLNRIADRAELSSAGLITYHFKGRRQLLQAILTDVTQRYTAKLDQDLSQESTACIRLHGYIASSVEFQDHNRSAMQASWQIRWLQWSGNLPFAEQLPAEDGSGSVIAESAHIARLENILRDGQADGEFRGGFDVGLMARTINSAVLGYMDMVAANADVKANEFIRHLQDTFIRAVLPQ